MKSTIKISRILFIFLVLLTTCQNDDDGILNNNQQETIPDTFSEYFGNEISRNFLGNVIDKNSLPIEGVTITIGNSTATTDTNGVFIINDATVNERFGYVKAEKTGYIHGSRSVVPTEGTNKVTIMLLEEIIIGTVQSGNASEVNLPNGSFVSFEGNFIKQDGSVYDGSVDVIMHHLDPTDETMEQQMPGMLYAENEDGAERMLQTFGMLAVELRGSNGEDINLAEGATSEIKMPIDISLIANAPSSIPLWYFDEEGGYWKEEGEATLQGNMYVGTVSHFSFWNCDIPARAVNLCVSVDDENGNVLNNVKVSITSSEFGTRQGFTNELGLVCGLIPAGEILGIELFYNGDCIETEEMIYDGFIGPFDSDSNINISINLEESNLVSHTVTGEFYTCDNNLIENGYVILYYAGHMYYDQVQDGIFEITFTGCFDELTFSLEGIDYDDLQTSGNIVYTFTSPITNIGSIYACNTYDEFITYQIGNEVTFITETIDAVLDITGGENWDDPMLQIAGANSNQNEFLWMRGKLHTNELAGTYDLLDSFGPTTDFGFNFVNGSQIPFLDPINNVEFQLTSIGEVGEYINITFSGTVGSPSPELIPISGTIHVIRDQ